MYYKEYMYYCPKCGDICLLKYDDMEGKCYICGHTMIESPHEYELSYEEYDAYSTGRNGSTKEERVWGERKQRLYDEVISKSPVLPSCQLRQREFHMHDGRGQFPAHNFPSCPGLVLTMPSCAGVASGRRLPW